jgi:peptidase C39-like protein
MTSAMAPFAVPKCEAEVCVPAKRMLLSAHGTADMQRREMVQKTLAYTADIAAFPDDPLLGCLLILARIHNRRASAEALTVCLPLINHRLTLQLFSRAAERAGLSAKVAKRDLPYISDLVLPAVLVLQNGDACALVRREETRVTVVLPESGTGAREISLGELNARYAGYAILAVPAYKFQEPAARSAAHPTPRWFWDVVSARLADLRRGRSRIAADQHLRPRHAAIHDECVRSHRSERSGRNTVGDGAARTMSRNRPDFDLNTHTQRHNRKLS